MAEALPPKLGSGGSIIWAILLIIFGFLAIALPLASSWGVVLVIAWLIIFSGGFQFIHAFQSEGVGHILLRGPACSTDACELGGPDVPLLYRLRALQLQPVTRGELR